MATHRAEMSVLGPSSRVTGNVSGAGGLRVEGSVAGDIAVDGPVEVTHNAQVTGNIEGESLDVEGTVEGDVTASGPIRVSGNATVSGTFRGTYIAVEPGAQVALQLDTDFDLDLDPARRR